MMSPRGVRSAIVASAGRGEPEGKEGERTAFVVERREVVEKLESTHDRLGRRGIHVVEVNEIVDTELLQLENNRRKVAAQNLGVGLLLQLRAHERASARVVKTSSHTTHLLDEIALRVKAEALSRDWKSVV